MMDEITRTVTWPDAESRSSEALLGREWLVTNGLGGYASATIPGVVTRRYHGLLVATLPAPLGRFVMLSHVVEQLRLADGSCVEICGEEPAEHVTAIPGADRLVEFRLESGLPVWRYAAGDLVLEKRVVLPHMQNTVHVLYHIVSGSGSARLQLRPAMHFHRLDAAVSEPLHDAYVLTAHGSQYEVCASPELPRLRLIVHGERPVLTLDGGLVRETFYLAEASRGYESRGLLWSPGYFSIDLAAGREASLVASTEPWNTILALPSREALAAEEARRQRLLGAAHPLAQQGMGGELVLAADQFVTTPVGRSEEEARARAGGEEVRTIIAGYHWFTDWGRDAMIALEGLTLATGRHVEAACILRMFADAARDGLIPNLFPEGEREARYHTADATLWLFHAIDRYLTVTGDQTWLDALLPKLQEIVAHHVRGTRFGIGVDPRDGLLRQGQEGYQLTWMDAKVGDWVVTPRRGKAVEINALWYNALRLLEGWVRTRQGDAAAAEVAAHAARACTAFNQRFWYAEGGYLYDVVDGEHGDDPACRPNQLLAITLRHPVLERARWEPVVAVVRERLLTPYGLRSLAPGHPDYKSKYFGDLRSRDAAYHQGTVWAWLIGPFIDAWLKIHPDDRAGARRFLAAFDTHLSEACVGSISEIFDAEGPFVPRGCIAQAWSVAEVLRAWLVTGAEIRSPETKEARHGQITRSDSMAI